MSDDPAAAARIVREVDPVDGKLLGEEVTGEGTSPESIKVRVDTDAPPVATTKHPDLMPEGVFVYTEDEEIQTDASEAVDPARIPTVSGENPAPRIVAI